MEIRFEKADHLKEKPTGALGFGKYYTDYMFVMDWDAGQGWHDARVVPYYSICAYHDGSSNHGITLCARNI